MSKVSLRAAEIESLRKLADILEKAADADDPLNYVQTKMKEDNMVHVLDTAQSGINRFADHDWRTHHG